MLVWTPRLDSVGNAQVIVFRFLHFLCIISSILTLSPSPLSIDCWLNDIQCSIQNCLIPCLKYKLFREPNNKRDGSLNDCLACDEKLCGPAFIECSGVNRRRLGISSDIGRSDKIENCATTDFPWLNMTFS
jgi:hypothetical protein